MTGLIAIDESGDLGSSGSRFFIMASIVSSSSRNLLEASRSLPSFSNEKKFYNSTPEERKEVLNSISKSSVDISYVVSEKNNPSDKKVVYGVKLYKRSLQDLVDSSLKMFPYKDVNIMVDGSRYIQQDELRKMCEDLCKLNGKNLKKCYKGVSQNEPCLRLIDYVVGAIRYSYEQGTDEYESIINEKISIARRY